MTLQLRTRLNGEIKDVNQLANKKKRIRNPQNNPNNKFMFQLRSSVRHCKEK